MGIDEGARQNRWSQKGILTSNPKLQIPRSKALPTLNCQTNIQAKSQRLRVEFLIWRLTWELAVGSALEFGIWSLGFVNRPLIRCPMASARPSTLGELRAAVDGGRVRHRPVRDEVRENLIARLRAG